MTQLDDTPPSIAALGISWPTTSEILGQAFRTRARALFQHVGATLDAYLALQCTYEAALALVDQEPLPAGRRQAAVSVAHLPTIRQGAFRVTVTCPSYASSMTIIPGPQHPGLRASINLAVVEHEHAEGHRCDTSAAHALSDGEVTPEEDLAAERATLLSESVRLRFTIVHLGLLGWRWIVWRPDWRGRDHIRRADMLDTGLCPSQEEAQRGVQAWGAGDPTAEETNRAVYRLDVKKWRKDRGGKTTRTPPGGGSQSAEYVYLIHEHTDGCEADCDADPIPHQIIEKTDKGYVVCAHAATIPVPPSIFQRETFVLSRSALDKGKSVMRHVTPGYGRWTLKPHIAPRVEDRSSMATCFATLGLRWPTTEAAVRQAYRRLALERHPDTGGSHDDFLELNRHYRQALSLVTRPGGSATSGAGNGTGKSRRPAETA